MRKRGRIHVGRQGPQNDRRLIALVTASYKVSGRYPCMYLEVNPTCNQESNQHRVGGYPQELTQKFTNGGRHGLFSPASRKTTQMIYRIDTWMPHQPGIPGHILPLLTALCMPCGFFLNSNLTHRSRASRSYETICTPPH